MSGSSRDEVADARHRGGLIDWLSAPLRRQQRRLPRGRVRSQVSAYVYGNVLVLGAVLAVSPHAIASGAGLLAVAATTVSTYAAHVIAYDVSQRIDAVEDEHREAVREELADAAPIIWSGVVPVLVLALGGLDVVSPGAAQPAAAAVLVVRLAITSWRIEALSGERPGASAVWSGLGLALAGTLVAVAKSLFHL